MNIADILSEFGAYYLNQGQNMTRLFQQIYYGGETDKILTPFFTDETVYRAAESRFQRVLQAFQKAWTPIGETQFVPVEISMYKFKVDSQEYPDDLEGSWLGFLAGDGIDRKQWPFVRWFIEKHLLPKMIEDYELNEIYSGVYAAPAAGVAAAAGTGMNGIKKVINGHVSSGRITAMALGALPTDPSSAVDYVEQFADGINKKYWNLNMKIACSQEFERTYRRGYRIKYGRDFDFTGTAATVRETNLSLVGLPSMVGANKIWCTTQQNVLHLQKKTQNKQAVYIESIDRLIKCFTDWWSGVGFIIPELVWTNDQDLV